MFRFCFVLCFVFLLSSCESESEPQEDLETSNFYALTVGNSWTYNYYRPNNQTGELDLLNAVEEILITEETEIDGEPFFEYQKTISNNDDCSICPDNGVYLEHVRDSIGYLINQDGVIRFAHKNIEDYLISENLWGDIYGVLSILPETISVQAGDFTAINNKRYGVSPSEDNTYEGSDNKYYSNGIGLVKETIGTVIQYNIVLEKHLASYIIN